MPRLARIVVPGLPHHVTQRGNNRQDVFFVDDDRVAYLTILGEECRRFDVAILGYCLMTNHVHQLLIPSRADALAKAMGRTHWRYTQHVNRVHGRTGHLWQNRFYSCATEGEHCLVATRYAERNPVRAGLCRVARRYRWSSAAAHCDGHDATGLLDLARWAALTDGLRIDWEEALAEPPDDAEVRRLRLATHTGRPLADARLLARLERRLGRRLRPLPVGRPPKRPRRK